VLLSGDKLVKQLYMLVDPIENLYGSVRPVILLAEEFAKFFDITIVAPKISSKARKYLESAGYKLIATKKKLITTKSLATLEAWLRREKFTVDGAAVINFSQCYYGSCLIYYAQGPMHAALRDIALEGSWTYRLGYFAGSWLFRVLDKQFISKVRAGAQYFLANSEFCKQMYEKLGIKVDGIIYPPVDLETFRPTTTAPSQDYVLTYFGKETKYTIIKQLLDSGLKIKAFGSRAPYIPKSLLVHPNLEYVGQVTDSELAELYSNALFTVFIFTHEPFGYIPVESMACGTPVLTYAAQGPQESVQHGKTGWLARTDEELVKLALQIWKEGVPEPMRKLCRESVQKFAKQVIAKQWLKFLTPIIESC